MSQLFSQTLNQTQNLACIQCGGTDYVLESGFYYCMECKLQSQDIREEVFEEFAGGQKGTKIAVPALKTKSQEPEAEVAEATQVKEFTSWEALNSILHGLVRELVLLGAPKELKIVALQLWACYLRKIEAVFFSMHVEKRPRLDLNFRQGDAHLVYGMKYNAIKALKKPVYRFKRERSPDKSDSQKSKSETSYSTKRMEKFKLSRKKRTLATAEYAASTSATSATSELTLDDLESRIPSSSQKTNKLRYKKSAKDDLLELLDTATLVDTEFRKSLQSRIFHRSSNSKEYLTLRKVIALLRISLLILDSDIHLGDLLRWSDEGYLSILNAEKLIPSGVKLPKQLNKIFISHLNSRENIGRDVIKLSKVLEVYDLEARILPLIERYLKELCLPSEIVDSIKPLLAAKPPDLRLTYVVNYEARALALILFVLKFLLGLDGTTERNISTIASIINSESIGTISLFSWTNWVQYINCRSSVISFYHQATRDVYHPSSNFGGSASFLSHWEQTPLCHSQPRKNYVIDRNLSECIGRFMKDFSKDPSEPMRPSLLPQSDMLQKILETKSLPTRTKRILQHDFTADTLLCLNDPQWQKTVSEKFNITLHNESFSEFIKKEPPSGVIYNKKLFQTKMGKSVPVILKDKKISRKTRGVMRKQEYTLGHKRSMLPLMDNKNSSGTKERKANKPTGRVLSLPGRGYWVYHTSYTDERVKMALFDHLAESVFQPDFLWVLQQFSVVGHISVRELYRELTKVENMYLQVIPYPKKYVGLGKW